MMNCENARRIAAAWEQGEALVDTDFDLALSHVESCRTCRSLQPLFMALAPRDSSRERPGRRGEEARILADRVMAGIGAAPRSVSSRPSAYRMRRRLGYAAAAALAVCAGFAFALFGKPSDTAEIRFVLDAPEAKNVFLAGDFSAWDTRDMELYKNAEGLWERKIRLRRGKVYTYNFLVDGELWVVDPAAPERIDDGFGGESALIRL